jgi:DNA gyrase subunit A
MKEPTLLPAAFPSVLVNANTGHRRRHGVVDLPVQPRGGVRTRPLPCLKNPKHDMFSTMQAPDFPGGGQIMYDRKTMEQIYEHGPRQHARARAL